MYYKLSISNSSFLIDYCIMNKNILFLVLMNITFTLHSQTIDIVCPYRYSNTKGLGLNPEKFIEYNGSMYFIGNYELDDKQYLWKSDGTWGGSFRVKEINPGNPNSRNTSVWDIYLVNNLMYIYDTYEKSFWRSDGTPNGTFTIMKGNRIYKLSELNSKVYFFALNKNDYAEFWQTDGTVNGTQLIKTLASQKKTFGNWPSFTLFKFNNKLLFDGIDDLNGLQLWETDGTDNGTKLLRKLAPASTFAMNISNFIIVNNVLYFGAKDSMENHRLWKSDGTELGTNTFGNNFKNAYNYFIEYKNKLYFNAHDNRFAGDFGQLFVTDGTDTGTHAVVSEVFKLKGTDVSFNPSNFVIMNNELYMTACSEKFGFQIWKTDGTKEGTIRITDHDSMIGRPNTLKVFDNHIVYLAGIYSVYTPLMHYTNGTVGDFHYQEAYDNWKDNAYYDTEFFPFKGALYFNSNCTSLDEYELYQFYFSKPGSISNQLKKNLDVKIFPNPSKSSVNVKSDHLIENLIVLNDLGQEILNINPNSNETFVEILHNGLYTILTKNGNNISYHRIIIQK